MNREGNGAKRKIRNLECQIFMFCEILCGGTVSKRMREVGRVARMREVMKVYKISL
jgi:hypothetical protein